MLSSEGKTTIFQLVLRWMEWKPLHLSQGYLREQSSLIQEGYRHKWIQLTRLETRTKESNICASSKVANFIMRNESKGSLVFPRWESGIYEFHQHHRPIRIFLKDLSKSTSVGTRKSVNYGRLGRSQRKLWWRSEAILTCKSFVKVTYRGERLIEHFSSWFPPKFPSGQLELKFIQFYQVKRMIRGLGGETPSTYSQTLNR